LGASTTTDDHEGEVTSTTDASKVSHKDINRVLATMVGEIMQRPTNVSAIKVDGKKAYDRARSGEEFELPSRKVTISQLDVLDIREKELTTEIDVAVTCSAGTYIRAIARDLGAELKVGGHLNVLRRTRVAGFDLDNSVAIDQLKSGDFTTLDLADVARATFSVRELELDEVSELSFGRPLKPNVGDDIFAALSPDNRLIALLKNSLDKAKPVAVFAAAN
jgi:tRNA pseudouridine55 synthase